MLNTWYKTLIEYSSFFNEDNRNREISVYWAPYIEETIERNLLKGSSLPLHNEEAALNPQHSKLEVCLREASRHTTMFKNIKLLFAGPTNETGIWIMEIDKNVDIVKNCISNCVIYHTGPGVTIAENILHQYLALV